MESRFVLCMCVNDYICIYIYTYIYAYVIIHIYIYSDSLCSKNQTNWKIEHYDMCLL